MRSSRGSEACQRASLFDQYQKHFIELLCLELNVKKKCKKEPEKGTLGGLNYCDLSI